MLGNAWPVALAFAAGLAVVCSSSLAVVMLVLSLGTDPALTVVLVLGANLGGAIPPLLATAGQGVPARRVALGNLIASQFRPWAVVVLFFGSAIGGALIYTLFAGLLPQWRFQPLIGGYPAVYGFVGAFTFLLWTRLGQQNANRMRAFTLIGMLLAFQLVFGILFQDGSLTWIAEIAGFACGFLLSFVLVPGGIGRVMRQIRQR